MDFGLAAESLEFRDKLRAYLDGLSVQDVVAETLGDDHEAGPAGQRLLAQMGRDGWLGVGWPREYGGGGRSAVDQLLFFEEMAYRRLPNGGLTVSSVGPTLMRFGSEEQKRMFLTAILAGDIHFAVGYTEPDVGTDVAAIRTRAVRDGDHYVVNGQKVYTTGAHNCSHVWLAVRTHPTESRHRGLSVLIVPLNTPGVSIRPLYTQADTRTNEVYFQDARVPISALVGEENMGWAVMMAALDFERLFAFSAARRDFEELVGWLSQYPEATNPLLADRAVAHRLAVLAAQLEVARLFALRAADLIDRGRIPTAEASALKVWMSELRHRIAIDGTALIGEDALRKTGEPGSPAGGQLEHQFRAGTVLKFASGTNEVQRDIIAQRGLGMPRFGAESGSRG